MRYYQAFISAESKKEAIALLKALVKKRLVVGGTIIKGPSVFWWKSKVVEMPYYWACPFTSSKHRKEIIAEVEKLSNEEVPIVYFSKIDLANKKFLQWIKENTN